MQHNTPYQDIYFVKLYEIDSTTTETYTDIRKVYIVLPRKKSKI